MEEDNSSEQLHGAIIISWHESIDSGFGDVRLCHVQVFELDVEPDKKQPNALSERPTQLIWRCLEVIIIWTSSSDKILQQKQ